MIAAPAKLSLGYGERLLSGIKPEYFARFATVNCQQIESNRSAFVFGHLSLHSCRIVALFALDNPNEPMRVKFGASTEFSVE